MVLGKTEVDGEFFSSQQDKESSVLWSLLDAHSKAYCCAAILQRQRNGECSCSKVAGGCLDS